MKKIVIIGANDFQNPLILKAKELGYETHAFAWKAGAIGEKNADYFYPISIVEKEKIYKQCLEIKPVAVVSIASDLAAITVNYVAKKLGLVCNNEECVEVTTNKFAMRKCLAEHGIPTPAFWKIHEDAEIELGKNISFPIIVKPTDRSGSRGITKLESMTGFEEAKRAAIEESFEKAAIVEEYIKGREYSCESISYKGNHYLLTITQKYTTGEPHFIETGHIEPADLKTEQIEKVKVLIDRALDALKVENGASHSEIKIDEDGNVKIIEIGARMGGDCIGSDLVFLSTGYDFVKMVIDVAMGKKPDFTIKHEPQYAAIRFIFDEREYEKMKVVEKEKGNLLVRKSQIVRTENVVDSSSRWGFYIMAGAEREELENILKE